jgi:PilZ domain
MTYSRRVKRLPAGWDGICRIEGEPGEWRCRVDDISMLGLGVTLTHSSPAQLAGRRIAVDVPAVAQLEGQITHAEPILGGAVHIGIVFSEGPSLHEAAVPPSAMGEPSRSS